jgi:F-type H+-transporting ATPase subunit delta
MSVQRIASRYAKSILDLAIEKGAAEAVAGDMATIKSATSHREFYTLLKSPIINLEKKTAIVEEIFSGKLSELTSKYLKLVLGKSREEYLPEIADEFLIQYKNLKKVTSVEITTAEPLSGAAVEILRQKLVASGACHPNVELTAKTDADIIGGFVLEFDSKRYDSSVAHKLAQLKASFSDNLFVKEI